MASSRRTYDTDVITLRTVFAKNAVNSNIPALRVLTADGAGGTYWAIPSSLGENPAFNEIITSAGTYTADLSYNRFRLFAGEGIGMVNQSNATVVFGKCFSELDVSGGNKFYAYTDNQVTPYIRVATTGAIQARSDPATNTLFIDGPASKPYIVSTGVYGFSDIKVTQAASTITSTLQNWSGNFITANSPSTLLRLIGYNDIQLSTNVTTNSIFFAISTFTSKGYLDISANAYGAYPSSMSTVSSIYTSLSSFNSTVSYLSSITGFSFSSVLSSVNALAMSTGEQFYILSGLINARATIIQLNSEITGVNNNLKSTVAGLGTTGYISTPSFVSSLQFTSLTNTYKANVDFNDAGRMTFSSFTFNLSSFSSFVNEKTRVLIQQSQNLVFSGVSSILFFYGTQHKQQTTTLGLQDTGYLMTESAVTNILPYSINDFQSNYFTTSLTMPLSASNVSTYIQSNFTTYHTIPNGYFFSNAIASNAPAFQDSTISMHFFPNSLFLHLYNS